MRYMLMDKPKDGILLAGRILLMVLFLLFGWQKLTGFHGTVSYMQSVGAPLPMLAAVIAVVMECLVALLIVLGFYTRPLALLMALYTLGTGLIGHHYWTMTGATRYENMINFYKNISIIGGLFLLAVTGPGKYSLDKQ